MKQILQNLETGATEVAEVPWLDRQGPPAAGQGAHGAGQDQDRWPGGKRLIKAPKLFFLDTGLAASLAGIREARDLATHAMRGALFETWGGSLPGG